jgi:tRNA nucleotidyltransferase (CCA-adding enzyme)
MFNSNIISFLEQIKAQGGIPYVVGGAVRDAVLGDSNPTDIDVEVYGITNEELVTIAASFGGKASVVGASFGVVKLSHPTLGDIDLSLPRRDNKVSEGYQGFQVEFDLSMSPMEGASRRDFTFNSLMWNPWEGLLDFFGGNSDLKGGTLRHVGPAFAEDPLRVLRAMQFAARFGLRLDPLTSNLCFSLKGEFSSLSQERVGMEWQKLIIKGQSITMGFQALVDSGWVDLFPQSEFIRSDELRAADRAVNIANRDNLDSNSKAVLVLAALCQGMESPLEFLHTIDAHQWVKNNWIVNQVMVLLSNVKVKVDINPPSILRFAHLLGKVSIRDFNRLIEANQGDMDWVNNLALMAKDLGVLDKAPQPLVTGKDLIGLGLKPGPQFGPLLSKTFQAQLDMIFSNKEGGTSWVKNQLK